MPTLPTATRAARRRCRIDVEHLHRGGLAVGAGDREPAAGSRRSSVAQPPGELDLAPDRDAARRAACGEQRRGRAASPGETTSSVAVAVEQRQRSAARRPAATSAPEDPEQRRPRLRLGSRRGVDHDDAGAELDQGVGRGEAGHAEPGHHDAQARPVGVPAVSRRAGGEVSDGSARSVTSPPPSRRRRCPARRRRKPGDDPEADHDRDLGPARELEVVLERRHPEDPLAASRAA